jgi:uncharacterized protein YbaP (TraB family)
LDENQYLRDALETLENQVSMIHSLCIEKQQAWKEFKLRFDTTLSAFNHSMELYQQNDDDLDQLKVFFHSLIFLISIYFRLGYSK